MSEPKSPADIAVQIICIVEKYVLEDRLAAHKAAPLVLDMIVAAQKQTRREALEEAANLIEGSGPAKSMIMVGMAKAVRELIKNEI